VGAGQDLTTDVVPRASPVGSVPRAPIMDLAGRAALR
jgi:hypothetical protein